MVSLGWLSSGWVPLASFGRGSKGVALVWFYHFLCQLGISDLKSHTLLTRDLAVTLNHELIKRSLLKAGISFSAVS